MSSLESNDASFLSMEIDGFTHPGLESLRDLFHRVDHGGDLDV